MPINKEYHIFNLDSAIEVDPRFSGLVGKLLDIIAETRWVQILHKKGDISTPLAKRYIEKNRIDFYVVQARVLDLLEDEDYQKYLNILKKYGVSDSLDCTPTFVHLKRAV